MKRARRFATALAIAAATSLVLAGCASNNNANTNTTNTGGPVSLTLWHNGTGDKSQVYWQEVVRDFEAKYTNVQVTVQVVQNEEFDGKLQAAMQANTTPDIFLQRGGGKLADMIAANQVLDITNSINADVKTAMGVSFGTATIDGKIYAMPMSLTPEGFWYNQDLFTKAGITTNPTDMAGLNDAVTKLKGIQVAPISVGAHDAWPAAHWYYQFALRECSQSVIENMTNDKKLDDPCWLKAFQDLATFNATSPWNDGFLTTLAQQGAGSSAGLLANGQAAMELMGAWEPGVVGDLTPDKNPLPSLRFFTFPSISGGQGDQSAMMAGSDGYSCSAKAPEPACTDFLNFIGQQKYSEDYATAYTTIPANTQAMSVVTDPALQGAVTALTQAKYVVLWFDTSLGQDVGNSVNEAVVALLTGSVDPAGAVAQMQAAVKAA
ncbi:MAG: extracellular solute-binding protein [Propionibacteriaceae bacterium]|nr:extracellular solute-binding protein [Propionibacteriaceae bacterium]